MRRTGIGVLVSVTILSGAIFSIEPTCAAGSRAFCGTWLSVCNRTCPGGAGTCGGVWSQARRVPYFRLLLFQHAGASMRGKRQGSGRNHPEQRQNAERPAGWVRAAVWTTLRLGLHGGHQGPSVGAHRRAPFTTHSNHPARLRIS
jgi:hypothetical protein